MKQVSFSNTDKDGNSIADSVRLYSRYPYRMKKIAGHFLIMLLVLFCCSSVKAQNDKFKALFLYNFIKNIEWPASYKQGDVVIGVFGNSPIVKELETITSSQKSGNQNMKVKVMNSIDDVSNCHIIYIAPSKGSVIGSIIGKIANNSTLVVSDTKNGVQQGAAINFTNDGDKLKFEISKNHIETRGLKVSTALLTLGTPVNN